MYCLPYVTEVVETVAVTEVMGDSANVDDVVPVVVVDDVVSEAERRQTNVSTIAKGVVELLCLIRLDKFVFHKYFI